MKKIKGTDQEQIVKYNNSRYDVRLIVSRKFFVVEIIKTPSECFSFLKHQFPTQTTLHCLHHQELELHLVIMQGNAPLFVVIALVNFGYFIPFLERNNFAKAIDKQFDKR